jgi:hypothetical protein
MAKYDTGRYGSGFKYGELSAVSVYYNAYISAWSYDYGTVKLTWSSITPDPTDPYPTYWMLVKSFTGLLDNPYDGIMLAGGAFSGFTKSFTDLNYTASDVYANYSIWVYNGVKWIFCGQDTTTVVGDRNSLAKMTSWFPKAWTNAVVDTGEALGEDGDTTFVNILSAYAFFYDKLRVEGAVLAASSNHSYTPSIIVNKKVTDFGFNYEPSLGDSYHRSLVGAGNAINSYKGTALGTRIFTTALTHWGNKVVIGTNLMLDYNDSSFEDGTGRWTANRGTLATNLYSGAAFTAPTPYIYDHLSTPRVAGYGSLTIPVTTATVTAASATGGVVTYTAANTFVAGQVVSITGLSTTAFNLTNVTIATRSATQFTVTNAATGTAVTGATATATGNAPVTLTLPGASYSIQDLSIPVNITTRYVFSGWVRHLNSSSATVSCVVNWYNFRGEYISSTITPTATTSTSTGWSEFTSKNDAGRNGQLSPTNASFATVTLTVTPTTATATTLYMDMFQLAEYQNSLEFEDARRVRVVVQGERENIIPNPSFEWGVGGWVASPNGSFAQDPTIYNTAVVSGGCVGELTIQSGTGGWISSDWFPVEPGGNYTFSAYASSEYPNIGRAIPRIEFSTKQSSDAQTATFYDSNGYYYDNNPYYVDGTAVTLVANAIDAATGSTTITTAPVVDTIQPQGSGSNYYPTTNGYPIQYVPVQSRVSVSSVAPVYSRDAGLPLAKVSIYYPDAVVGQTVWTDGVLFQETTSVQDYFSGSGGANVQTTTAFNPTTNHFFSSQDTVWEYKNLSNYIQNPSFETTSNWSISPATATLTSDLGPGSSFNRAVNANGTYANSLTPATYTPLYGTHMGKLSIPTVTITGITNTGSAVTYRYSGTAQVFAAGNTVNIWGNVPTAYNLNNQTITSVATVTSGSVYSFTIASTATGTYTSGGTAQLTSASISTTVYLPSPAIGGEDFVISASVRAAEGTYTIGTSGSSTGSSYSTSTNVEVYQHDQYQWVRIHDIRQLIAGETYFTATITLTAPPPFYPGGAPGYTIATTSFFHIDSAQGEYGRVPNAFVDPAATTTTTMANPGYPAASMYVAQIQSTDGGRSSYFNNFKAKYSRLLSNLSLIMPQGSTYCVKPGYPAPVYPDITESLIPSASFERDLGSWAGSNSVISRVISRGSLFSEFLTHGLAYCLVTSSGTNNATKTFGINTGHLTVVPNQGYYCSVAIRPANANSTGSYTLRVDYYDANNNVIPVYTDNLTGGYTVNSVDSSGAANTLSTDAARAKTFTVNLTTRWAYLANTFSAATTVGASYAVVRVTFTPTSWVAGQAFHIDRAVFRQ